MDIYNYLSANINTDENLNCLPVAEQIIVNLQIHAYALEKYRIKRKNKK